MPSDSASSISVAIRVRPFTVREAAQLSNVQQAPLFLGEGSLTVNPTPSAKGKGIKSVLKVIDDKCLVFDPPDETIVQRGPRIGNNGRRAKDQTFAFDRVFDENATQGDIYECTTRSLLDSVMDGYNATVFAYGATGCGKTHTITGTVQAPGVIFLTMQELFERIAEKSDEKVTEISLSYLEIYNETIRDLLVTDGSKQALMLREDAHQTVSVAGLSSHRPQNVQEVMDMIVKGNECRTVSPTDANATSSRSHAVLQVNVSQKDRNADINEAYTMATLSIIDLAGSERASATKNRGERLQEGANINKSLLALGSCINALCDPRKRNHIPYRNSKLTRLLKFSLGGNCRTVMIVCISPSSVHFDETQNTLRYANRAKNIQTKVTRNVFNVNRHVKDFVIKIDEQMALINELKQQIKEHEEISFAKFHKQAGKREMVTREAIGRIRKAYEDSTSERLDKVKSMVKLRQLERRVGMIESWVSAFDRAIDTLPHTNSLEKSASIKKAAQGILYELEASRHHYHQKIAKSNWERAMDSALQHGIRQLKEVDPRIDAIDASCLGQQFELLKGEADREALQAILQSDKENEFSHLHVQVQAHFESMAAIQQLMSLSDEEAQRAGRAVLGKVYSDSLSVTSHIIKPNASVAPTEAYPPEKSGTPKHKRHTLTGTLSPAHLIAQPLLAPRISLEGSHMKISPAKSSPRRRKGLSPRKGVSFTPKKRSPVKISKRAVRWRDDVAEGTLAEFEKTPDKEQQVEEDSLLNSVVTVPNVSKQSTALDEESPAAPTPPLLSMDVKSRNNRFKTGFLSKKNENSPPAPALSLLSSDSETSPLREVTHMRSSNRLPSQDQLKSNDTAVSETAGKSGTVDEGKQWKVDKNETLQIKAAIKRASLGPNGNSRQRRKSPTASSTSPTNENMFTVSHARRMVRSEKEGEPKLGVLSPRTAPIAKHAVQRRTTLSTENRTRDSVSLSKENCRPGVLSASRGSLMGTSKGAWR